MAYQIVTKMDGAVNGPQLIFSDDGGFGGAVYLVIGAYNDVNNIVSGNRPLVIQIQNRLQIVGLTTPPAGTPTSDLVVDAAGNVYRQS